MTIVRINVAGKTFYSVNGYHIRREALDAIGKELFSDDGWAKIANAVATLGFATCNINAQGTTPDSIKDELIRTKQKNAALEKQIAQLKSIIG